MKRGSILVVEHNADTLSLWQWLLESEGFTVVAATNSAFAIQLLSDLRPDLILVDLMMPQAEGLTLIRRVRATKELATIPIVAITTYADQLLLGAATIGASAVLHKFEDLERLTSTIKQMIAGAATVEAPIDST